MYGACRHHRMVWGLGTLNPNQSPANPHQSKSEKKMSGFRDRSLFRVALMHVIYIYIALGSHAIQSFLYRIVQ